MTVVGYGVVHFGKDADANRRTFEFAKSLGSRISLGRSRSRVLRRSRQAGREVRHRRRHPQPRPGHRYAKIETIAKAIKDHHPKIGCCIDTGHFLRSKEDPVDAVEAFGNAGLRRPLEGRQGRQRRSPSWARAICGRSISSRRWPATSTVTAWRSNTKRSPRTPSTTSRPAWPRPPGRSPKSGRHEKGTVRA